MILFSILFCTFQDSYRQKRLSQGGKMALRINKINACKSVADQEEGKKSKGCSMETR